MKIINKNTIGMRKYTINKKVQEIKNSKYFIKSLLGL